MANIFFSPALQAPFALSNPTGVVGALSDPSAIAAQANPIPPASGVSMIGAAVRVALAVGTQRGAIAAGSTAPNATVRLVTARSANVVAISAAGQAPTLAQGATNVLSFPRLMLVGNGGDQSYGSNATTSYPKWTTAAAGTAANIAIQTIGSYDIAILSGVFENWDTSGARDRENLSQALLKSATTYSVTKNTGRPTLAFYYHIMGQGTTANSGGGYQQLINQIVAMNGWLYESAGGIGTITPAADTGNLINYSTAWPSQIGSALPGQSIVGTNYGSTSSGSPTGAQGVARTNGNYAALKLLIRGSTVDSRFTFNAQMASPSAAGVFLDNAFAALNGSGSVADSSLDGISIAPGSQQGGGYPALDTVQPLLAKGISNFFAQMQTMASTYGTPGKTYYNFANFGQYANKYQFGTATLTAGLENTLHGGLLEDVIGAGAPSWEYQQTGKPGGGNYLSGWPNLLANYYQGMDFCQSPKLVGLGVRLPASDASSAASWPNGGGTTLTSIAAGTALEYQLMRYGLCTALLDDGYFAPGCSGYDWSKPRWYDEYGDDSLAQVNVKRGYLGAALTTRPTAATWAQGTMGIWSRAFSNGIAIVNPRGNGAQTVTLGKSYSKLLGTQQPSINNGATISSVSLADGDGIILLNATASFAPNRPSGLTTLLDRQFNPTDPTAGTLPPASGVTDSFKQTWLRDGSTAWVPPLIDTPANLSAIIGATIPALPDGNTTCMAVKYPAGWTYGTCPMRLIHAFSVNCKTLYICQWVLIPPNFNSNGNNIKWWGIEQGGSPLTNHILMLSSNGSGVVSAAGAGKDYRGVWLSTQGGPGGSNYGGQGGVGGAITQLSTTPYGPTGSGPGWWNTNYGSWHLCEWLCTQEGTPGASTGVFKAWFDGALINYWNTVPYNAASGDPNAFNIADFIPYYGGGGSNAPADEYICVGRTLIAGF